MTNLSRSAWGVILVGLICLAGVTRGRAEVWTSEETLWADAIRRSPEKPRPWINYALALERRGAVEDALQAHQRALALSAQPRLTVYQQRFSRVASETNIARMLAMTGHEEAALLMLDEVLTRHPFFPHARYNRGVLYARLGRCPEALVDLELAARLDAEFQVPVCP